MHDNKFLSMSGRRLLYWGLILGGLALVIWQFFTFMDVVQGHTAQAEKISQSASWAGQPVGTMPQSASQTWSSALPEAGRNTGMMRVDFP